MTTPSEVSTVTALGDLHLPSPVMTASGCAAAGAELAAFGSLADLGAVVTKSIMASPRAGRPTPRMAETPSGMLNSIGLQGPGVEAFVAEDLPRLHACGARTIASVAGGTAEEFQLVARRLVQARQEGAGLTAIEVNASCPNVANRSLVFACDPVSLVEVVAAVREVVPTDVPLLVKLSPDVTDIVAVAHAAVSAGADGLVLINTLLGMVIDPQTLRPVLAGKTGGLSGPAVRAVAVRCVYQVHAALPTVPIVGVGGVMTGQDAVQLMAAGASAVQVGTATFHDPSAVWRVGSQVREVMAAAGVKTVAELVGAAHR
jgi:dihydroorotate dehydrogenase (NAD+) catalytic subunit